MRRRKPAPHGFAVNGNLNKIKRLILMCRICSSPPGNLGNHAGRLAVDKPFTGSPKVLLITTQGRPTHLTCGQNDSAYHNPPPKVMAKRATTPSFRSKCIARNQEQQPPSHKREAALALVRHGAFSEVRSKFALRTFSRSLRRERTRMAGIHFSSYKANVSFSPFAL